MSERTDFGKFSAGARKVLSLAQEESQRFQHNYIGTEHLLLGLIREQEGLAARLLTRLGLTIEQLRRTTELFVRRGDRIVLGQITLNPLVKQAIEMAVKEAQRLGSSTIETEHLLLGLTQVPLPQNTAGRVLQHLGLSLEQVREATIQLVSGTNLPLAPPAASPATLRAVRRRMENPIPTPKRNPNPPEVGRTAEDFSNDPTFSPEFVQVLRYSKEEALLFSHNYIGTEHLLIGILHDQQGNAAKILYNLGVDQHKVRSAVEFLIGRGDHIVGNASTTTLTPRAQKTIALASDAAYTFKSDTIKPEHLLIGLVYEDEGIAAGVLESLGVSKSKIYEATTHVLENNKSDAGNSNHEDEQN